MSDVIVQLNPQASPHVFLAGNEKTPVVIIDNFATDTSDAISYAVNAASFDSVRANYYPGLRARPPSAYVREIVRTFVPLLGKVYSVPGGRNPEVDASYSLVATPPDELHIFQRIPHFDSNKRYHFAVTHYLNPGKFGGTGLFRHRPTGFENITQDRVQEFMRSSEAFGKEHGEPPAEYIRASTDHFEYYLGIEYRPNRVVAYPGSLLHSGLIDPETDISSDPATGRLTGNFFIDFD